MTQAYLEAVGGLSGDMMLGALVDAGLPLSALEETIEALGLGGEVRVGSRSMSKCGIGATKVDVEKIEHHHHHHHDDAHEHAEHEHEHHEHTHGRSARELIEIVEAADGLDEQVRERSVAILRRLAEAEAKIHDTTPEEAHFPELGRPAHNVAVGGAVEGPVRPGLPGLRVSPLPIGHGWINCAHGRLPVPAPATAELLRGVPTTSVDIEGETVTPTGAALAAVLADGFGRPDVFVSDAVGYGCGNADFDPIPNVVRLTLGAAADGASSDESRVVTVIEANIDDMTGELVPNAIDMALAAGALDCWSAPIVMKKGRPALLLRAICEPDRAERVAAVLLRETTTLGVRMAQMQRRCLARRTVDVSTRFGQVAVKLGCHDGAVVTVSPEYEDCRRAAEAHSAPLKLVYAAAVAAAQSEFG